jgi:signal recognition particle receptor subunit beta
VDGIIFVVDSSDRARFLESATALRSALEHTSLAGKPLLVMANKNDIEGSASSEDVGASLQTNEIKDRPIQIAPCSAKLNQNMDGPIKWIVKEAVDFRKLKNS